MTRKPRYWTHKSRPGQKFLGNYEWEEVWYGEYNHIFKLKNAKTGREIRFESYQAARAKGWRLK